MLPVGIGVKRIRAVTRNPSAPLVLQPSVPSADLLLDSTPLSSHEAPCGQVETTAGTMPPQRFEGSAGVARLQE
jgi:hypothetical protein